MSEVNPFTSPAVDTPRDSGEVDVNDIVPPTWTLVVQIMVSGLVVLLLAFSLVNQLSYWFEPGYRIYLLADALQLGGGITAALMTLVLLVQARTLRRGGSLVDYGMIMRLYWVVITIVAMLTGTTWLIAVTLEGFTAWYSGA